VIFLGPPGTGKTHCETGIRRSGHGRRSRGIDQRELTCTASLPGGQCSIADLSQPMIDN
jgi:hypothetical protein